VPADAPLGPSTRFCCDNFGWWESAGIDATVIARELWLNTHPLPTTQERMGIKRQRAASKERITN